MRACAGVTREPAMRRCVLVSVLIALAVPMTTFAQTTVGILPFFDESGSGSSFAGTSISRSLQAELKESTSLTPRALDPVRPETMDSDRAMVLAREHKLDLVLIGTIVEARTEESTKSGWLPRIQGQQVNLRLRSIKATAKLRGELYDVASGKQIATVRAEGKSSDNKVAGTVWSTIGAWDAGNDAAFRESPLGRAIQAGVEQFVQRMTPALSRR